MPYSRNKFLIRIDLPLNDGYVIELYRVPITHYDMTAGIYPYTNATICHGYPYNAFTYSQYSRYHTANPLSTIPTAYTFVGNDNVVPKHIEEQCQKTIGWLCR